MSIKVLLLLIIYSAIGIADLSKLRKLTWREITVYSALLLVSLYLGLSYVYKLRWPFLGEAADALIGKPARFIVEFLKAPS